MGKLKKIINEPANTLTQELKEQLRILDDLAEEKATNIQNYMETNLRTTGGDENRKVPIDWITGFNKEIHVFTSASSNIGNSIKSAVSGFIGNGDEQVDFVNGISGLLDIALNSILGTGFGRSTKREVYFLVPSKFGITRIDSYIWIYDVDVSALTNICQNLIVAVNFKSVVDMNKISLAAFLQIYQEQLAQMSINEEKQDKLLNKAEENYRRLNPQLAVSTNVNDITIRPASNLV